MNFFVSLYSISTALSMCYVGAKNETAVQLKQLLNLEDLNDEQILDLNKTYISSLNNLGNEISLNTANKIYPSIEFNIKKEFIDLLEKHFFSEVQELEYSKNVESTKIINDWVSEKTVNKVNDILDPSNLDEHTKMVLVNAIYFKGSWLNKFDPSDTYEDDFHLDDDTTQKVNMMKLLNKGFSLKKNVAGLKADSCELPYAGESISMTIILPHEDVKLSEVESQLNPDILKEVLIHNSFLLKTYVYLPKFKIEYKSEVRFL